MSAVQAPDPIPQAADLGAVHFVGIGGAGMSGIARIMLSRGFRVSGSDAKESRALATLRALGATVHVGHAASHVADVDTVVVSSAIRAGNPELLAAREAGLLVLPRAAALAAVMAGRRGVAVAGTHGKTTTTSMLTVALQHCGADPSFAIGGSLNESGANAHNGSGELFVAEADESDGSFLLYTPEVAIVTNVEADHLDHYGTAENVDLAFEAFARRLLPQGTLVICLDDPGAARLGRLAGGEGIAVRTYGEVEGADVRIAGLALTGGGSRWTAVVDGEQVAAVALRVPGRHNALNAAAALAAATVLGVDAADVCAGLGAFTGTRRRFELKGTAEGIRVVDDYAHHPTELTATLAAAREVVGGGRLVVAFQPHRYTRTAAFRLEFGQALALADEVVVMDVYSAGESPLPGATGAAIAAAVPLDAGLVVYEPSWSAVAGRLVDRARSGDLVLTLGAGDVTMIGAEVLGLLRQRAEDERRRTVELP